MSKAKKMIGAVLTMLLLGGCGAAAAPAAPTDTPIPTEQPTATPEPPTPTPPLVAGDPERGQEIFETGGGLLSANHCSVCHSLDGSEAPPGGKHAPTLQGITERAGERVPGMSAVDYLRQSIVDPGAYRVEGFSDNKMMEGYHLVLGEEDIDDLIAFMLTQ